MGTLIMVGQLLLGLSIIVGLHELGHLITAKIFKMRVEKYSIGFPPKIFGFNWGETEYSLGAIPLGGFVKISGMIDESFDTKHLQEAPKDYEFRSKPAWQRLIVMMGGILVNIVTGIIMFIALIYIYGESYLPASEAQKYGIVAYDLAEDIGLKTGDKIIKINGRPFERFNDVISPTTLLESNSSYTVLRDNQEILIQLPNDLVERLSGKRNDFFAARIPFKIGEVIPGSPAAKAGLQKEDQIIEINGKKIEFFHELIEFREANKGKSSVLTVKRGAKTLNLKITPNEDGTFGFYHKSLLREEIIQYGLIASIGKGTNEAFGSVVNNIKGFGKIFRGEVSLKSVSGPIGIVQAFSPSWDWYRFWFIIAVLSMWLAFLNFLPIPALDGGHVMFLMYEIISGNKPSDKFLQNAQTVGIIILLALMVFVLGNDIVNLVNRIF
ncbi:MAG: RIP metalloprotease RseP [Microscillaceae bacterium]|nr:RIP metalloprotease RseP [Microscillaceae bacterium]